MKKEAVYWVFESCLGLRMPCLLCGSGRILGVGSLTGNSRVARDCDIPRRERGGVIVRVRSDVRYTHYTLDFYNCIYLN